MAKKKEVAVTQEKIIKPLKLDLGCASNKCSPEHTGVDISDKCGADVICDLSKPNWPFEDNSVDEAYCSHFLEHLDGIERMVFMNELYRVMKPEATARIITPAPFTHRYMQDPTHKFPMIVQEFYNYLLAENRKAMGVSHYPLTCNFSWVGVFHDNPEVMVGRNLEYRQIAARHYINTTLDLDVTITKK